MIRRYCCAFCAAPALLLCAACEQSVDPIIPPTASVQSALSDCTVDVQGIGEPYFGWVALKNDGTVWKNRNGGAAGTRTVAMKVESLGGGNKAIAKVDGESQTFCVIRGDDSLWCWGDNYKGQVGSGNPLPEVAEPTKISFPGDPRIVEVGTGGYHSCARTSAGHVYCWGNNEHGELGLGTIGEPVSAPSGLVMAAGSPLVATQLSVGFSHTCVIVPGGTGSSGGSVLCWGHSEYGEIGNDHSSEEGLEYANWPSPQIVIEPLLYNDVSLVSAGGFYTCVIRASNASLWCFGDNTEGHLACGDTVNKRRPVPSGGAGSRWIHVDTGVAHGCGVKEGGSVWCWGRHNLGMLGTLSPDLYTGVCNHPTFHQCTVTPQQVTGITSGAIEVSVKDHGACAIMSGRELRCWGAGNTLDGQGPPNTILSTPVVVDYCSLCDASSCGGNTPVCSASGACAPCTDDFQCPTATPACLLPAGTCAQCSATNYSACANTNKPKCDSDANLCVECIFNDDCMSVDAGPICKNHACGKCISDGDCLSSTHPGCLPSGRCGVCSATNTSNCAATHVCDVRPGVNEGTCVGCITDADCKTEGYRYCDSVANMCRGCLRNEHCPANLPVCVTDGYYCSVPSSNTDGGDGNDSGTSDAEARDGEYGICAGCATAGSRSLPWQIGLMLVAAFGVLRRRRPCGGQIGQDDATENGNAQSR